MQKHAEKLSYIFTPKSVQVVLEGKPYIVREGAHYNAVLKGIKEKNIDLIRDAVFAAFSISKYLEQFGPVRIERGSVFFHDSAINGELAERILAARGNNELMTPLCAYMANVQQNPDPRARTDLFGFLCEARFPITQDGCIIGLKIVDRNFKDIYTRTMDNRPGSVIQMPREQCDSDPSNVCSRGIHFCTPEYLNHYGKESGARVVVYKIHPKDIVAFPRDYNWAKVRCCEALVLEEVSREDAAAFFYDAGFLYEPKKELARALQRGFRFIQSEQGWHWSHAEIEGPSLLFPTQEAAVNATFGVMLAQPEPEDPEDPEEFTEWYEDDEEPYPGLLDECEAGSHPWYPEGDGWIEHTPGDPQPVADEVRVHWLTRRERREQDYFPTPSIRAMHNSWGKSDVYPDNDIVAYLIV